MLYFVTIRDKKLVIMEVKVITVFILVVLVPIATNAVPATNIVHTIDEFNAHSAVETCVTVDGLIKCTKKVCGWDKKAKSIICTTTESDQPLAFNKPENEEKLSCVISSFPQNWLIWFT